MIMLFGSVFLAMPLATIQEFFERRWKDKKFSLENRDKVKKKFMLALSLSPYPSLACSIIALICTPAPPRRRHPPGDRTRP